VTKAPPRRPTGSSRSSTAAARATSHLQVAAADDVLTVDGVGLPLRPRRRRSARLIFWIGIPLVVLAGFASLLIVPTRAWINQQRHKDASTTKLEMVREANAKLEEQIAALGTDEEIIRIARARYNLVRNGDQVMAVLPSPAPYPLPNEWPYTLLQDIVTVRLQNPDSMPGHTPATTIKPSATTESPIVAEAAAAETASPDAPTVVTPPETAKP
jgi:cell division protein FtsB